MTLALTAGQTLKDVVLRMSPQGTVSGRIVDVNGDPVDKANVALLRRGYTRGTRQLLPAGQAATDDRGEFRIANVPAGHYTVSATPNRGSLAQSADRTAPLVTYYPNSPDTRGAAFFDLAEGQDKPGIQIQLRQGVVFAASGKVTDTAVAPVAGAIMIAAPKDGSIADINGGGIVGTSDGNGVFALRGLVPGNYFVVATNFTTGLRGISEFSIGDKDVADISVRLGGGGTIRGTVRLEDGDLKDLLPASTGSASDRTTQTALAAAAAAAPGLLGIPAGGGLPSVAITEANTALAFRNGAGVLNQDGTLIIENVLPGDYTYTIAALPAGTYVKSVKYGGADVTHARLRITGPDATLDITLAKNAPAISGSVVNDKGDAQPGTTVAIWSRDPDPGSPANGITIATADRNGAFQVKTLAPGTYYAAAFEDIDNGLAQARDLLTLLTSDAQKLELKAGDGPSLTLKAIPAVKITAAEEKLP